MHRRPTWHPPSQRIFLPSGFVVTMPKPEAMDQKVFDFERSLAADHHLKIRRDGAVCYPHPCLERYVQQQANSSSIEMARIRQKHLWREYQRAKMGQRGGCPHEYPEKEARPSFNRDELQEMKWNYKHFNKMAQADPIKCGLCLRDKINTENWMKGTEVQLIDIAPVYAVPTRNSSLLKTLQKNEAEQKK
jgi:hypothetical protein